MCFIWGIKSYQIIWIIYCDILYNMWLACQSWMYEIRYNVKVRYHFKVSVITSIYCILLLAHTGNVSCSTEHPYAHAFCLYNDQEKHDVLSPFWVVQHCFSRFKENIGHNLSNTSRDTTATLKRWRNPIQWAAQRKPAVSSKNKTRQHYFCGRPVRQRCIHWATTCQQEPGPLSPTGPFSRPQIPSSSADNDRSVLAVGRCQ